MSATPPASSSLWRSAAPLARSVMINLVAPALAYRVLQHQFRADSPVPLLICALIPAGEFAIMFWRRRVIDAIALFSVSQLAVSIAITLFSVSAHQALLLHALQSGAIGTVFGISALIGQPLIRPLARQSVAGVDPGRIAAFDERARRPEVHRRFAVMSLIWSAVLSSECVARLIALRLLAPADYLLFANVVGSGTIAALVWGSVRYGRRKMRELGPAGQPAA